MRVSKFIFRMLITWPALVLGNLAIVALIYVSVHSTLASMTPEGIINLRSEAISTIIIAWGVLIESRELVLRGLYGDRTLAEKGESLVNNEAESTGIFLVIMGLSLEMVTYFDVDVRAEMLPGWIHSVLRSAEWGIMGLVCYELVMSSLHIVRLKVRRIVS